MNNEGELGRDVVDVGGEGVSGERRFSQWDIPRRLIESVAIDLLQNSAEGITLGRVSFSKRSNAGDANDAAVLPQYEVGN